MKKGYLTEGETAELCAEEEKPTLVLVGTDGNVFSIIGKALRVARDAGFSSEKIEAFKKEVTSGDYDHALQTCMDYFDVC